MRDCPGYMHLNWLSIVRAPTKFNCKIVRAIGQLRVHCVKMQYEIAAQRGAVEKTLYYLAYVIIGKL